MDGNEDATGYPCLDQVGRSTDSSGLGSPQAYEPLYEWNNTINDLDLDISIANDACEKTTSHIVEGRDYFNDTQRPGYTPYTYPHPLTLLSAPLSAPQNVRIE